MIVAIHQPQFMPWLGYFDKIDKADLFVFLDNVQFKKNEWQNRNRIKTAQGWQWLTLPVKHSFGQKINEIKISNEHDWKKKHLGTLVANYRKAPYFDLYFSTVESIYEQNWQSLSELNKHIVKLFATLLRINTEMFVASKLEELPNEPDERLIAITKKLDGKVYLAGAGGQDYMNLEMYCKAGVKVQFQEFEHPVYPQRFGEFVPGMSIIDLLFNCGEKSIEIIRGA